MPNDESDLPTPPIMPDDESNLPTPGKHDGKRRQAKGCCLLSLTVMLILLSLAVAAVATIIIVDSVSIRGEGYTMERRVQRYKVACRFIWEDFKDAVSRWKMKSSSSPVEPEIIQSTSDPSGAEPEP